MTAQIVYCLTVSTSTHIYTYVHRHIHICTRRDRSTLVLKSKSNRKPLLTLKIKQRNKKNPKQNKKKSTNEGSLAADPGFTLTAMEKQARTPPQAPQPPVQGSGQEVADRDSVTAEGNRDKALGAWQESV